MLTSAQIKECALNDVKVDLVGIANIERFADAPPDMDPKQIMPTARSVIVFAKQILRGSYRGIDEGTHWPSYTIFCYAGLNGMLTRANYRIARFIEGFGHEAVCICSGSTSREKGPSGPPPKPGKPRPNVVMSSRIAATLAGIGEIGWSKVFLTEEFGPRQRLGVLLTDVELEPDPIRTGHLCDRCKRCVPECPGGAIHPKKSVGIEVEGHRIEWNDLDLGKCKLTHFGLNRKTNPHLVKRFPGLDLPIDQQQVTWREAWDLGYPIFPGVPIYKALSKHPLAACGARGCIIGCMKHMEQKQKVKTTFHTNPVFSRGKPWSLPEHPEPATHNGFIYDPDQDQLLTEDESETDMRGSWY